MIDFMTSRFVSKQLRLHCSQWEIERLVQENIKKAKIYAHFIIANFFLHQIKSFIGFRFF